MKTIQPYNDSSSFLYHLPAPAYTSTEGNMLLKDRMKKDQSLTENLDINLPYLNKGPYNQYSDASEPNSNLKEDSKALKKNLLNKRSKDSKGKFSLITEKYKFYVLN